jgi:hypothetical protein
MATGGRQGLTARGYPVLGSEDQERLRHHSAAQVGKTQREGCELCDVTGASAPVLHFRIARTSPGAFHHGQEKERPPKRAPTSISGRPRDR